MSSLTLGEHAQWDHSSWVCVSVCYSRPHFSNIYSSYKQNYQLNWQWRSKIFFENSLIRTLPALCTDEPYGPSRVCPQGTRLKLGSHLEHNSTLVYINEPNSVLVNFSVTCVCNAGNPRASLCHTCMRFFQAHKMPSWFQIIAPPTFTPPLLADFVCVIIALWLSSLPVNELWKYISFLYIMLHEPFSLQSRIESTLTAVQDRPLP